MNHGHLQRKLAAILYADVAGYSRLTDRDEAGTHRLLCIYLDLLTTAIKDWQGRVVNFAGDAVLAEFSSAVEALACAAYAQRILDRQNETLPEERRLRFRLGINLGDVIVDRHDLYGDGVNVAARLEDLAEPGGICISEAIYKQARKKLPLDYVDLGLQSIKNIDEPIHVYRVVDPREQDLPKPNATEASKRSYADIFTLVTLLACVGLYYFYFFQPNTADFPFQKQLANANRESAIPAWLLTTSDTVIASKPSIAVLPFSNLGDEASQEYFSDGLTHDLIADLSRFHDLLVIASNTMFTYKGRPVKVRQVGRELGVRYVLEGSVQQYGDKLRITAQLIDAATGVHLWVERYDRNKEDLFKVRDAMIQTIVGTLAVKIDRLERERALRKDTDNLEAHDYLMRGRDYYARRTRNANREARRMFAQAVQLDPQYASAYARLGMTYLRDFWFGWTEFPDQAVGQAHALGKKALAIDGANADAHLLLGYVHLYRRQYELALAKLERAIAINPNNAESFSALGEVLLWSGQIDNAIQALKTELRLDPSADVGSRALLALAHYLKGQYVKAAVILEENLSHKPDHYPSHIYLTATYAQMERQEEAEKAVTNLLRIQPFLSADAVNLFRDPAHNAAVVEGLRKAGLP